MLGSGVGRGATTRVVAEEREEEEALSDQPGPADSDAGDIPVWPTVYLRQQIDNEAQGSD